MITFSLCSTRVEADFDCINETPVSDQCLSALAKALRAFPQKSASFEEERKLNAIEEMQAHPEYFSEQRKQEILRGKIVIGMSPYEVGLAGGGGFLYQVEADKRWPNGTNPMRIINAQTANPDDSKITLTYRNTTQFESSDPVTFSVDFERGRVTKIMAQK
jgi:hypothetical protein